MRSFIRHSPAFLLVLACILAVYGLSVYKKVESYSYWQENAEEYFVDSVTAMADMDTYHWLKMARDLDEGKLGKGLLNVTRGYPDLVEYADANLLARLISLCKSFTGGNYYHSGLLLVTVLGGAFVFPLFFYFHRLGFGASAVLGGLVGLFSRAYYERSRMGTVDTDMLNIFFPLAIACFILPMSPRKSLPANLGLAFGAGAMMYLFNWWYEQFGIMLVYLFVMAVWLLVARMRRHWIPLLLLVFVLTSGPQYALWSVDSVVTFLRAYFFPQPLGQIVWPDVMELIAEAQKPGVLIVLQRIHGLLPLVCAGFAGLAYLYVRHFRRMIPVTPLILLGLWSLFGPLRFAMYLAPFIGVGIGVLIELLVRRFGARPLPVSLVSIALMLTLFFSTATHTDYHRIPAPIVPAAMTRAMLDIKQLVPRHSAMLSWWDSGYPLMQIGEFATYHDGSLHGGLRSTLIGKALFSPSQGELLALLSWLEDHGFDPLQELIVNENLTAQEMEKLVFSYPGGAFRGENVHILYSEDMIRKFGSISESGAWDFNRRKSDWVFYERWNCSTRVGNIFKCREGIADLDRGVISDGVIDVPLNAVLFVNNGEITWRRDYHPDAKYYLQVLLKNNQLLQVQVVEDRLFLSNFNQQFLLGQHDRRYFEEIYNNFPVARAFRVLPEVERSMIRDSQ